MIQLNNDKYSLVIPINQMHCVVGKCLSLGPEIIRIKHYRILLQT